MSDLRQQICDIGALMYRNGYIDGTSGNISARLDNDHILTTPSGVAKGFMTPDQLIVIDMDGQRVDSCDDGLRPTSEVSMHLECYRQRDDIGGVVHAHPPTAVALTLVGYDFQQPLIPEMLVMLGVIPTAPYSTPASSENRDAIHDLIGEHDAIMLANHGSLTVADTVWDAYMRLETLEHGATIIHRARQLNTPLLPIPDHQIDKLLQTRESLGLIRPGDQARFAALVSKFS